MKFLRKFIESVSVDITQDDIEDHLLELIDIGYTIDTFDEVWLDENNEIASIPSGTNKKGYVVKVSLIGWEEITTPSDAINIEELSDSIKTINEHSLLRVSCLRQLEKRMGDVIIGQYNDYGFTFTLSPNSIIKNFSEQEESFHFFMSRLKKVLPSTDYYKMKFDEDKLTIDINFYESYTQSQLRTIINKIKSLSTGFYKFRGTSSPTFDFEIKPNISKHHCFIKYIGRKQGRN